MVIWKPGRQSEFTLFVETNLMFLYNSYAAAGKPKPTLEQVWSLTVDAFNERADHWARFPYQSCHGFVSLGPRQLQDALTGPLTLIHVDVRYPEGMREWAGRVREEIRCRLAPDLVIRPADLYGEVTLYRRDGLKLRVLWIGATVEQAQQVARDYAVAHHVRRIVVEGENDGL